jgi:hypothetical protein
MKHIDYYVNTKQKESLTITTTTFMSQARWDTLEMKQTRVDNKKRELEQNIKKRH